MSLSALHDDTANDLDNAVERLLNICTQYLAAEETVSQDQVGQLTDEAREVTRLAIRWVALAEAVEAVEA